MGKIVQHAVTSTVFGEVAISLFGVVGVAVVCTCGHVSHGDTVVDADSEHDDHRMDPFADVPTVVLPAESMREVVFGLAGGQ